MKFISLFGKVPSYKRFGYAPRFYDAQEEERKAREERIRKELDQDQGKQLEEEFTHRQRISGSFKKAKKTATVQSDPSANMLRLIILLFLTLWLVALFQFGTKVLYAGFLLPIAYFYLKFRKFKRE
jgi:Flp pilus assembly protein TadB